MSQTAALIHPPGGRKEGEEEEEVDQTAALIKFSTSGAQRVSVRLQEGGVPGGGNCFFCFFGTPTWFLKQQRLERLEKVSPVSRMASEPSAAEKASSSSMHRSIYESTSGAIKIHIGEKKNC